MDRRLSLHQLLSTLVPCHRFKSFQANRKRAQEDSDTDCAPATKYHRTHLPASSPTSVDRWVLEVYRPTSVPLPLEGNETSAALSNHIDRPKSLPSLDQLPSSLDKVSKRPQESAGQNLVVSGLNLRPGTSSQSYREVLYHNGVDIDRGGRRLPQELQDFRDSVILKARTSPELTDDQRREVKDKAEHISDKSEFHTTQLMRTAMLPLDYGTGTAKGGNTQWPIVALPNNPLCLNALSAPKPDIHLGYAVGSGSNWTVEQASVMIHPNALPHARPTITNTWPFLMVEVKSEATGGTLWHAENQAAGSGSYAVKALVWLLEQSSRSASIADTAAFTIAATHRQALLFIHWRSEQDPQFCMSLLKQFSIMDSQDIRSCNRAVKNIIDRALGTRKTLIENALEALYPYPEDWESTWEAESISNQPSTSS